MANVRFLDQVPVTAFTGGTTISGRVPRFLYVGETLTVRKNDQLYGFNFFNFGVVTIDQGEAVIVGDQTYYSDGLIQIATVLTNEGLIVNKGIIINSEDGNNN